MAQSAESIQRVRKVSEALRETTGSENIGRSLIKPTTLEAFLASPTRRYLHKSIQNIVHDRHEGMPIDKQTFIDTYNLAFAFLEEDPSNEKIFLFMPDGILPTSQEMITMEQGELSLVHKFIRRQIDSLGNCMIDHNDDIEDTAKGALRRVFHNEAAFSYTMEFLRRPRDDSVKSSMLREQAFLSLPSLVESGKLTSENFPYQRLIFELNSKDFRVRTAALQVLKKVSQTDIFARRNLPDVDFLKKEWLQVLSNPHSSYGDIIPSTFAGLIKQGIFSIAEWENLATSSPDEVKEFVVPVISYLVEQGNLDFEKWQTFIDKSRDRFIRQRASLAIPFFAQNGDLSYSTLLEYLNDSDSVFIRKNAARAIASIAEREQVGAIEYAELFRLLNNRGILGEDEFSILLTFAQKNKLIVNAPEQIVAEAYNRYSQKSALLSIQMITELAKTGVSSFTPNTFEEINRLADISDSSGQTSLELGILLATLIERNIMSVNDLINFLAFENPSASDSFDSPSWAEDWREEHDSFSSIQLKESALYALPLLIEKGLIDRSNYDISWFRKLLKDPNYGVKKAASAIIFEVVDVPSSPNDFWRGLFTDVNSLLRESALKKTIELLITDSWHFSDFPLSEWVLLLKTKNEKVSQLAREAIFLGVEKGAYSKQDLLAFDLHVPELYESRGLFQNISPSELAHDFGKVFSIIEEQTANFPQLIPAVILSGSATNGYWVFGTSDIDGGIFIDAPQDSDQSQVIRAVRSAGYKEGVNICGSAYHVVHAIKSVGEVNPPLDRTREIEFYSTMSSLFSAEVFTRPENRESVKRIIDTYAAFFRDPKNAEYRKELLNYMRRNIIEGGILRKGLQRIHPLNTSPSLDQEETREVATLAFLSRTCI